MVDQIISGGQAGADLAGIDWAISKDLPWQINTFKGFKPVKGRSFQYENTVYLDFLMELPYVAALRERTKYNVRHSDCTFIFLDRPIEETSGTLLTLNYCRHIEKSYMVVPVGWTEKEKGYLNILRLAAGDFHTSSVVNVAGPRDIDEDEVKKTLDWLWECV